MKKSMAVLLTAAMGAALLTGCGSSSSTATTAATTTAAPASEAASSEAASSEAENENQQWQILAQKLNSENSLLLKQNTELLNWNSR